MLAAHCQLVGITPYSQSRMHDEPKLDDDKEAADSYDERTWREHCHVNREGLIVIPPMGLKFCLEKAASYLQMKIKGQGQATWTKHFKSGVLVIDPPAIDPPTRKEDLPEPKPGDGMYFVNANGKRGSGTRVWRRFPEIMPWSVNVSFYLTDAKITEPIFEKVLAEAGQTTGLGRFRPENGGWYGRFNVEKVRWEQSALAA